MKTTTKNILKLWRGIKKNLWFYKRNRIQFWVFLQLTQRGWDLVSQLLTYSPNLLLENIPSKQPTSHHRKGGRSGVILSRSLSWVPLIVCDLSQFLSHPTRLSTSCCVVLSIETESRYVASTGAGSRSSSSTSQVLESQACSVMFLFLLFGVLDFWGTHHPAPV